MPHLPSSSRVVRSLSAASQDGGARASRADSAASTALPWTPPTGARSVA